MSAVICLSKATILKLAPVCSSGSLRGLPASWHTCCSGYFRETTGNGSASVTLFPFSTCRALQKMSEWLTSLTLSHPQSSFSTIPSWFQVPPQREVRTAFCSRRNSDRVVGGSVNQVRIPLMPLLLFFFYRLPSSYALLSQLNHWQFGQYIPPSLHSGELPFKVLK